MNNSERWRGIDLSTKLSKVTGSVGDVVRDGGLFARALSDDSAVARSRTTESVDFSPPPPLRALNPTTAAGCDGAV